MKSPLNYLLLIMLLPLFMACDDNCDYYQHDHYRVDIGTVINPNLNSRFSFLLDNNQLIQVTETNVPSFIPKNGQRIIANYTILSETKADSTVTRNVKLNNAYTVLTKGIFNITPATQDSIGHDSIYIRDMWIGSDYLNIEFAYWGNNKTHYINLVSDASKVYTDGKTHLEFRHNGNGDTPTYYLRGIVSFRLKSLQPQATANSLDLVIHVKEPYHSVEKMYTITYNFGSTPVLYKTADLNSLMQEVHEIH
ncbi:MAG: NigD-like protein [Bacteroidota bacterium]|nr:NigD-like protein [Bacteroidota bacterium]